MLRTTVGVSFLVLFGVAGACSSKATDGTGSGGTSGNGALLGGSGGTGGAATGGIGVGRAGSTGTTGGSGLCADETITCVDDTQATGCNPDTGVVDTIDCVAEYAEIGVTSTGCSAGPDGEGCDVAGFKDAACLAGAQAYAFCAGSTNEQLVNVYINCFQDYMGAHSIVTCLGNYVSQTMTTDADCQNASDACLDGAGGAGGAGPGPDNGAAGAAGAGGAP